MPASQDSPIDADALHRTSFVFDGHTDVPTRLVESSTSLAVAGPGRHADAPRLRAGGVDGAVFALFVPPALDPVEGLAWTRRLRARIGPEIVAAGLRLAEEPAALKLAFDRGETAVVLSLENGRPLSRGGALDELEAAGVRLVTLSHVATHEWCDAAGDDPVHGGLSPAGEEIVRDLVRRGIVVDVSHISDAAVEHVLDVAQGPVVASHSSARALCDHPRNLPDHLVAAIARRGGLVMANAYPAFLTPEASAANARRLAELGPTLEALEEAYRDDPGALSRAWRPLFAAHPLPLVHLDALLDHLLHLVEVAGPEAVGIGTDFDGIPETPAGFEDASRFPALTAGLLDRGLDQSSVRLVLGANFLRVWGAIRRR